MGAEYLAKSDFVEKGVARIISRLPFFYKFGQWLALAKSP
jgi:hypothetical protein